MMKDSNINVEGFVECKPLGHNLADEVVASVREWKIDCVVIQSAWTIPQMLREAGVSESVKIIMCYHFVPSWEMEFQITRLRQRLAKLRSARSTTAKMRQLVALAVHPLYLVYKQVMYSGPRGRLAKMYRDAYSCADRLVLLSDAFVPEFCEIAGVAPSEKLIGIPNALSFDRYASAPEIAAKNHTVLIVSRLEERQKRISLALKIWDRLCTDGFADGWELRIVGTGDAEKLYRRYVKRHKVPRVTFLGRMNPYEEYQKASLFFMTSRSEGWGITLTEAQQLGVVPLAFDTYASLHDIITDGEDGCIIAEGNVDSYVRVAAELMADDTLRREMATKAVESSKRFAGDKIADIWYRMLCEVSSS